MRKGKNAEGRGGKTEEQYSTGVFGCRFVAVTGRTSGAVKYKCVRGVLWSTLERPIEVFQKIIIFC